MGSVYIVFFVVEHCSMCQQNVLSFIKWFSEIRQCVGAWNEVSSNTQALTDLLKISLFVSLDIQHEQRWQQHAALQVSKGSEYIYSCFLLGV